MVRVLCFAGIGIIEHAKHDFRDTYKDYGSHVSTRAYHVDILHRCFSQLNQHITMKDEDNFEICL
jgi:hypothetical protein